MVSGKAMSKELTVAVDEKWIARRDGRMQVLGSCHFQVSPGELLAILGESGCGKSTLLRMLLSLDNDYQGAIKVDESPISLSGLKRSIVFQEPRLLPWLTTIQNVEFAMSGEDSGLTRQQRATSILELVGLSGFESNWPRQLSGGMAQRTALARALVNAPDLLLLDEPFAALDLHTRFRLQDELLGILGKQRTTTILVTHDIDEALYLGDRVLVMSGRPGTLKALHSVAATKPRDRTDPYLLNLRTVLFNELVSG